MFYGSMVAIVTPFKNGKIDEAAFKKLIDRQIENGTSAIIPCGTTGESATLTHAEHDQVIRLAVEFVNKKAKVLAGAGSNATHEAVRLNQSAEKLGADGTLHITPYYNRPNQEGLYQHFKAVAESSSIPVVLYNVPGRTGVNMLPETVARLSGISNIIGIKEAAGNLDQVKKLIELCPKDFLVLSGEDALTFDMYQMGARGSISVTANVAPKECALQWDYFKNGKIGEAQKITEQLMPLHKIMFCDTNPIPVKAALAMMGLITEEYRLPLVSLSKDLKEKLKKALQDFGIKI